MGQGTGKDWVRLAMIRRAQGRLEEGRLCMEDWLFRPPNPYAYELIVFFGPIHSLPRIVCFYSDGGQRIGSVTYVLQGGL